MTESKQTAFLTTRAISVLKATIGILSNNPSLIYNKEYFEENVIHSLLADFHEIKDVRFTADLDAYFYVFDYKGVNPEILVSDNRDRVVAIGDFSTLEKLVTDKRLTLFSNLGILARLILSTLERCHNIYSFHGCSLLNEKTNELLLVVGGPGSGKTCFILNGFRKGLKLFSSELTHFTVSDDNLIFYKGSTSDNVRIGTLKYDFPEMISELGISLPEVKDVWGKKIAINLAKFEAPLDEVVDPELILIFPHVEENIEEPDVREIKNLRKIKIPLFKSLSEKLASAILYETIPVESMDNSFLREKRLKYLEKFMKIGKIKRAVKVLAGPRNCLEGIV